MFELEGKLKIFNEYLRTGIFEYNGNKYYADSEGTIQLGYQTIDGKTYFFSRDKTKYGIMRTGMFEIDGQLKIFDEYLKKGLFDYNGKKYYANSNGELQFGFQTIEGKKYFFSRDKTKYATMVHGWITYNNHKYYFDENGVMVTGYRNINNRDYLFDDYGRMNTGFVTINGKTYYYFANGSYANDWLVIGNKKYFFNSLGELIGSNVKKIIDISSYQGDIDWEKVKKEAGIDGVIVRIAAGCEKEDSKLAKNIEALKKYNIPYGIYIYSYAENYNEGKLYAEFTINTINKYNLNPSLGVYLDLESNSITSYMGVTQYTQVVKGYMETIAKTKYKDITKIYTYKNYADTALNSEYIRNQITWIAQYNHNCTYSGNYVGWQYSSTEKIPGISGNVDVSVWFK